MWKYLNRLLFLKEAAKIAHIQHYALELQRNITDVYHASVAV